MNLFLLGDTNGPTLSAGGLGVLTSDSETPVMSETSVGSDLLQSLQILTQFVVQLVTEDLGELAVLDILLPVEEVVWDFVLAGVLHDLHDSLKFLLGDLSCALGDVDICFLQYNVAVPSSYTSDRSKGVHNLLFTIDVGVKNTKNMLELGLD